MYAHRNIRMYVSILSMIIICMYIHTYVRILILYVRTYLCKCDAHTYAHMYACVHIRTCVYMYVCTYFVSMYVCMYVCTYVYWYTYVHTHCMCVRTFVHLCIRILYTVEPVYCGHCVMQPPVYTSH